MPVLKVYSKEGLPVGLGVSVRYQLDPRKLPDIENSLPQPVETELMPPVVANAFRQTISSYMVRDVFSTKREEVRRLAAEVDHAPPGRGRHRREGSDDARPGAAARVRERRSRGCW